MKQNANSRRRLIIAIDGPSGAGKSTVARMLAERLGFLYVDTGAMYRAVALAVKRASVSPEDENALAEISRGLRISFSGLGGGYRVLANDEDITDEIRSPDISLLTSVISGKKAVRDVLLREQRRIGEQGNVVFDGRDIGSIVFPDADVKIYLTASAEERGKRRFLELTAKGEKVTLENTIKDVVKRDTQDEQRQHAPLVRAKDAVSIDSTGHTVDQVLDCMEKIVHEKGSG